MRNQRRVVMFVSFFSWLVAVGKIFAGDTVNLCADFESAIVGAATSTNLSDGTISGSWQVQTQQGASIFDTSVGKVAAFEEGKYRINVNLFTPVDVNYKHGVLVAMDVRGKATLPWWQQNEVRLLDDTGALMLSFQYSTRTNSNSTYAYCRVYENGWQAEQYSTTAASLDLSDGIMDSVSVLFTATNTTVYLNDTVVREMNTVVTGTLSRIEFRGVHDGSSMWVDDVAVLCVDALSTGWKKEIPSVAPCRFVVRRDDGSLLGGRVVDSGHKIEVLASTNSLSSQIGKDWSVIGAVANNTNVVYGDLNFLSVTNDLVFCAFRMQNTSDGKWSVVVCKSTNGGVQWIYDSTIESQSSDFVGAPFLFMTMEGNMQIYYDSEILPKQDGGIFGDQWIAMRQRAGTSGSWSTTRICASRKNSKSELSRHGMPSVVSLGASGQDERLMIVTEGCEEELNGGQYSLVINAVESYDGGSTWDYADRVIVNQGSIHESSGRRYRRYCPMACRNGVGPVHVLFCSENHSGMPKDSGTSITITTNEIWYIETTTDFETWGNVIAFWDKEECSYQPGMFEYAGGDLRVTISAVNAGYKALFRALPFWLP